MSAKLGIQETKELLKLIIGAANAAKAVGADGKVDLNDLPAVMAVLPLLGPGIGNIGNVPAELMDVDSAEGTELVAQLAADLGMANEKVKELVIASFKAALALAEVVGKVQALKAE
jgi:hypothetical protein